MSSRTKDDVSRVSSKLQKDMNCRVKRDYADYRNGKHVSLPKRLLVKVRAKARLADYADLYKSLTTIVGKVVDIEKQLQMSDLSAEVREAKQEKQEDYMARIDEIGPDMAKALTKYMKSAGAYYNVRTDYFIDSHKSLRSLKRAKKAKLKKNPFIRFYTFLRGKYRRMEKMVRDDDREYIENAIDNLVGRNANGELLYNPEMLNRLKPTKTGAITTVVKQPDIPTPVKAVDAVPVNPPVVPVTAPVVPSTPARTSISLDGFGSIQDLIADNQRLSDENDQLRGAAPSRPAMRR